MNKPAKPPVPDDLLLAAIDRAERHRQRSGVPIGEMKRHLGLPKQAHGLGSQLDTLAGAGVIEPLRRSGIDMWGLTSAGRRRLERALKAGADLELPESQQHQNWRNAQLLSEQELENFREGLLDCLNEAKQLLESDAASDAWLDLAPRLHRACWRVGSATYCAREWEEPDDSHADEEELTPAEQELEPKERNQLLKIRAGRRNPHNWKTRDA